MKKANEILKEFFENSSIDGGKNYHSFFRSWAKIAGIDVATHSNIEDIRGDIVFIEVDHPGWIQTIQMKKRPILKRIQEFYPELGIKDLRFHMCQRKNL